MPARPRVSIIMANYNGARFVRAALRSVLRQTLADLEVLVVDDGSTDDSVALIEQAARDDPRIRLFRRPRSGGPGAARNVALEAARGDWLAVVDSDDLIHAERLAGLVAAAEADGADIAIDDLLIFSDAATPPRPLFRGRLARAPQWIDLAWYIRSNRLFGHEPSLGFTKPVIRRRRLAEAGVRYDEALPVAEDHDLVARLLLAGLRMRAYPRLTYFYRKHAASISHRLDMPRLDAMVANAARFRRAAAGAGPDVVRAQDRRDRSIDDARAFTAFIDAIKRRRPLDALAAALRRPPAMRLLAGTVRDRTLRLLRRPPRVARATRDIVVITQQRVVGATNGSSTYLLSLCGALAASGRRVSLLAPSPRTFGSWPLLPLKPEMRVFDAIRVRGGLHIGQWVAAWHGEVLVAALRKALAMLAARLGLRTTPGAAPPAVGATATRADLLFIARHARHARLILADYAFAAPLAAYGLSPEAPTAVVMHDLFSARPGQFAGAGVADSVSALSAEAEAALLGQADAILAIQQDEADQVRRWLPATPVLLAPLAAAPRVAPAPGLGQGLLFVGSNTAPNVIGLRWFLDEVWPWIAAAAPGAELCVAGNVSRAFDRLPAGVRMLGPVADLARLYDAAAVVVSPLIVGSGLKIKLIEALARGKAMVVTPVTLQGVEQTLGDAVRVADQPRPFADAVVQLLASPAERAALGQRGLERIAAEFSAEVCYRDLLALAEQTRAVS